MNIDPRVRWWLYLVAALVSVGYGAYQVSMGDWGEVIKAVLAAFVAELARQNTPKKAE